MSTISSEERLAQKTPEATFLHILQEEFHFAPRVARELLTTAQDVLHGAGNRVTVRPGQIRLIVASLKAPFGPPLAATDKAEVTLTVDAGSEDAVVRQTQGGESLRQGRILRLTAEALEQGGVLTHEDLAKALGVDARTIRRDVQSLKAEGHVVPTRGMVKGVGRGQTHKVQIIALWLDREGYDKIERWVHHSAQAIKRYISLFLRVVTLHRQATAVAEIAFVTGASQRLVQDYLDIYEAALTLPHRRAKLEEELARVGGHTPLAVDEKKGGRRNEPGESVCQHRKTHFCQRPAASAGERVRVVGGPAYLRAVG